MFLVRDFFLFAKTFTVKRLLNALKLLFSYYLSKLFGKNFHSGFPAAISFEPTTSCNLSCPECPSGLKSFTRPTGNLDKEFYQKTIDELAPYLTYVLFYFQGEPFINSNFLEMVRYAKGKNLYTATSTNAHFLHDNLAKRTVESGLDRLIISIDGTSQEVYESYRIGGKLERVIEGTKNVLKWRKTLKSKSPLLVFQFLVVKPNQHQIDEVVALGKSLGVDDVWLKTAQIYDYQQGNPLIPDIDRYSRYRKKSDGTYEIKNAMVNQCWKMWHSCVITWDGLVVPCCFDKDAHHQLGSLQELDFKQVWHSKKYQNFRSAILRSRSELEICKNCSEGTKVWA